MAITLTSTKIPLLNQLHSASYVDYFWKGKFVNRNPLDYPAFGLVADLNFQSFRFPGESVADVANVLVGNTIVDNCPIDGYGGDRAEITKSGQDFNAIFDGAIAHPFHKNFFNDYSVSFLPHIRKSASLTLNVESGTLDEAIWEIQQVANATGVKNNDYSSIVVCLGAEQKGSSVNKLYYFKGNNQTERANSYKNKLSLWEQTLLTTFHGIQLVIDAAPTFQSGQVQKDNDLWNDVVGAMKSPLCRIYCRPTDAFDWGTDHTSNKYLLNEYFDRDLPYQLDTFITQFPDKRPAIIQWQPEENRGTPVLGDSLFNATVIARFYKFLIDWNIETDNMIPYASYMSLKNLIDSNDIIDNKYLGLKLAGMLFGYNRTMLNVASDDTTIYATATNDGTTTYILLVNQGDTDITLSTPKLDGKKLKINSHNYIYGSPAYQGLVNLNWFPSMQLVKANSINLILGT
jgi:hypothetical protein